MASTPSTPMRGYPSQQSPPPPVIPTKYLLPHEQRWFFVSIFGLIEAIKIWDILAPYIIEPEPTWSSQLRVRGPWTAASWTLFEVLVFAGVSMLRIPMLSPSYKQLGQIAALLLGWNVVCWFVAEPGAFFMSINLVGPVALGGEWYWAWWHSVKKAWEPKHVQGVHKIRLIPYSTATLNPLSLTYCIPPDPQQQQHLYIPVVFNNSIPEEISYYIRSLETGHIDVRTILGASMKKSPVRTPRLRIAHEEEDEEDVSEPDFDPLSALVLQSQKGEIDVAKIPSVKPTDSLAVVPRNLESSQNILYLSIDHSSVISLKAVTDKRGDRFHITPHKEAVIVECPVGGRFMDEDVRGILTTKADKPQPAENRCVGDEEVAKFQARGVGALKAGWKKRSKEGVVSGVIEGIEDESHSADQLGLVHRDMVSKTHTIPLRVVHDKPGVYTVSLTSITDSLHNTYTPSGPSAEIVYNVLSRPSTSFDSDHPRELLLQKSTTLPFTTDGLNGIGSSVDVVYSFRSLSGEYTTRSIKVGRNQEAITVTEPGTYSLVEINGPCSGTIKEPSSIEVYLVPPPTVSMQVTTLHECAMDVGVTVDFDFAGTMPFTVYYTEQRKGSKVESKSAKFGSNRGDIRFQPDHEGEYTYTFKSLSDAKYQNVKLDQPPIKQTVHPLANVELLGKTKHTLYACSGNEIEIEFEAKGSNPLTLVYVKSWNSRSENTTIHIPPGRQTLHIPVPQELSADSGVSGKMTLALVSIEDGNGCARRLNSKPVEVDIHRQKPTARFAKREKVIVTEGEVVRVPMRLIGQAPWEVVYDHDGQNQKTVMVRDANSQLSFEKKGVYRLVNVKDAHCPRTIDDKEATFEIDFKPRPSVDVLASENLVRDGGVYRHQGLCAGQEDQVALRFTGQLPFELGYRYTTEGRTSKHGLKSAQETGILHLATEPGHHRYDLLELKDTNYPNNPLALTIEHDVYSRPSASFIKQNSISICLDQDLKSDAKIKLNGKAPFELSLAVRKPASTSVKEYKVTVENKDWTLDLPHTLTEVGRHEVSLVSVQDASGCLQEVHDSDRLTTIVEVVESAKIVPVGQQGDLCVGDTLDFLLQGKAPWTIEYEWVGKRHKVSSSASRFSRYAEEKGVFEVKSVALKDNQCKREITDMIRTVHPLPSVKSQEGLHALREGDEPAASSVSFTGTPPFSFTYTRSEQQGHNGKTRIVDTRTVTDIWEERYEIQSSLPGDYAVTSVSDRYCRYPPLSRRKEK